MMTEEITRCIECNDKLVNEPIGVEPVVCSKCDNTLCGYCCEFQEVGK